MSNIIDFEDYWGPENRIVPESPPPLQHPIPQPTPEIIPPEPEKHFIVSFTTTIQGGDFDKIEIRHDNFLETQSEIITVKKLTISTVRSKTNETQVSIKKRKSVRVVSLVGMKRSVRIMTIVIPP